MLGRNGKKHLFFLCFIHNSCNTEEMCNNLGQQHEVFPSLNKVCFFLLIQKVACGGHRFTLCFLLYYSIILFQAKILTFSKRGVERITSWNFLYVQNKSSGKIPLTLTTVFMGILVCCNTTLVQLH